MTISPTKPVINYVKLVNPVRKSEYVIQKVRGIPKCTTIDELKAKLCDELKIDIAELGYISPGHGLKGKLNPLTGDEDLEDMYGEYKNKRDIILWCCTPHSKSDGGTESNRKKRSLTFDKRHEGVPPPTKKQACAQKIKDVEAIVDALKEKHATKYSVEQLNAWAHMIQLGKHVYQLKSHLHCHTLGANLQVQRRLGHSLCSRHHHNLLLYLPGSVLPFGLNA